MRNEERTRAILRQSGLNQDPIPGRCYIDPPTSQIPRTRIESLVPEKPFGRLEMVVLRRYPRRFVNNRRYTGHVAAACGRDETGLVGLVLWGDEIEQVQVGDIVRIEHGWCRRHGGEMVVSSGRNGKLTVIES